MMPHRDKDGIWRIGYVIEHGELLEDPQADHITEQIGALRYREQKLTEEAEA